MIVNLDTVSEYNEVISRCRELFVLKNKDYGLAWTILRLPSLTDQILIKAYRIRSLQEKVTQKISDSIETEFIGMINYSVMALILLHQTVSSLDTSNIISKYDAEVNATLDLLKDKNHDYDEVWRKMRVSSMTDIILMKLMRIKQIEDANGETKVSEGVSANYQDIINYSVFCLIKSKKE